MFKSISVLLFILCLTASIDAISFFKKFLFKQAYQNVHHNQKFLGDSSELWIEQKLDNFEPRDERTWYQRYFVQESFGKQNGPVFLQIGGEGPASAVWMNNGHWIEMAKKFNAICFQLEHRFYGLSQPTKDVSLENLKYLSSEQALADLSNFIAAMNHKFSLHNRKWIVFGGSYPGSLAIWARLKYPHLISGAVSASAPLVAQLDFSGYNEVVQRSLTAMGSDACSKNIATATELLGQMLSDGKYDEVEAALQGCRREKLLCQPLTSFDVQFLQQSLADNVAEVVQYNNDARSFEDPNRKIMDIKQLCEIMGEGEDPDPQSCLHNYGKVASVKMGYDGVPCFDASYQKYLSEMSNSSWSAAPSAREWVYQTCTEFGWYQTATSSRQPFRGFPLSFFERECRLLFGVERREMRDAVRRTNVMYGGMRVADVVTNTTLYNGLVDPWSDVSYVGGGSLPAEVVADTAHCAIMYPSKDTDSRALAQARIDVEKEVAKWLGL